MNVLKSSLDCLLEDNEDQTFTVAVLKPWAAIQRVYVEDSSYYEYLFDDQSEANEFYNWVVEDDNNSSDVVECSSDCLA